MVPFWPDPSWYLAHWNSSPRQRWWRRLRLRVDPGVLAALLLAAVLVAGLAATLIAAPDYGVMTETYFVD